MQQDGWSIIQNDQVIATSVVSQGKGFFVDDKDTGTAHKTAEACKTTFEDLPERTYGSNVRSFTTDNASNVQKMRTELEKEDENLIIYGRFSHVLNLLAQDLT